MTDLTAPIFLASASPRRRELLRMLGVAFEVVPSRVDEEIDEDHPVQVAESLALRKARAVAAAHPGAVVIGSDTVVVIDGQMLAKPADPGEARRMLTALRARAHEVITGVAVIAGEVEHTSHGLTVVYMRRYSDREIDAFIASGEPFDKAGGYAIQDEAFAPVARFEGCRCNVIGLPLGVLRGLLENAGIRTLPPELECPVCAPGATK